LGFFLTFGREDQEARVARGVAAAASPLEAVRFLAADHERALHEMLYGRGFPLLRPRPPKAEVYVPRFEALARDHAGYEAGAEALVWLVEHGPEADLAQHLQALAEHHLESEAIGRACLPAARSEQSAVEHFLAQVIEANKSRSVQGFARLAMARHLALRAQRTPDTELERRSQGYFKNVARDYADVVPASELQAGVAAPAKPHVIEIGQPAPEIVGKDVDGQTFKLSDYRGKVVLLDFWGHW